MATADKLALLKATKADLKAALTEQGQTPGDVFETYPDLVRAIETGVTLPTLTSPGAAADLRQGKQLIDQSGAVVNGAIPDKAGQSYVPTTASQKIAAGQYLAGDQIIAGDANLLPENIVSGKSIFGVAGTLAANKINVTIVNNSAYSIYFSRTMFFPNGKLGRGSMEVPAGGRYTTEIFNSDVLTMSCNAGSVSVSSIEPMNAIWRTIDNPLVYSNFLFEMYSNVSQSDFTITII